MTPSEARDPLDAGSVAHGLDPITILLPVGNDSEEHFQDAVRSVMAQSSEDWRLIIGVDDVTPSWLREAVAGIRDPRIDRIDRRGRGLAPLLNAMMQVATTDFVSILLSDDRLVPHAVATLQQSRRKRPDCDYFYSSRRYIDEGGTYVGESPKHAGAVALEDFRRADSMVKHLMCWRRTMALDLGGVRGDVGRDGSGREGTEDFDFAWRMCEAGARFLQVEERLYEYRVHSRAARLTNDVPLQTQVEIFERMFLAHGLERADTVLPLQEAIDQYRTLQGPGGTPYRRGAAPALVCWRRAGAEHREHFVRVGLHPRHFFAHRVYLLPRAGRDGLKRAEAMCQVHDTAGLRQLLLFAAPESIRDLPRDLFFDEELSPHGQQLGMPGLIATATLIVKGDTLSVTSLRSDLVRGAARREEHREVIEERFGGWAHLLVNAILDSATDMGVSVVRFPDAALVGRHTDPNRLYDPAHFRRIYDHTVRERTVGQKQDAWWTAPLSEQTARMVPLAREIDTSDPRRVISISHDIQRGLGHREDDPFFAEACEIPAREALERMLGWEAAAGIAATYNVVGQLWEEVAAEIKRKGGTLAFHSFRHVIPRAPHILERLRDKLVAGQDSALAASTQTPEFMELVRCRQLHEGLRGYRPPHSRITMGLHDRHLAYWNFEWMASSEESLGSADPMMENGIVKIPIHIDDTPLYRGVSYSEWEKRVLEMVERRKFISISLHDCHAPFWIDRYPKLLDALSGMGVFKTFDDVADDVLLASTRWI